MPPRQRPWLAWSLAATFLHWLWVVLGGGLVVSVLGAHEGLVPVPLRPCPPGLPPAPPNCFEAYRCGCAFSAPRSVGFGLCVPFPHLCLAPHPSDVPISSQKPCQPPSRGAGTPSSGPLPPRSSALAPTVWLPSQAVDSSIGLATSPCLLYLWFPGLRTAPGTQQVFRRCLLNLTRGETHFRYSLSCGQRATLTFCWTNFIRKIKATFRPRLPPPLPPPNQRPRMSVGPRHAQVSGEKEQVAGSGLGRQHPGPLRPQGSGVGSAFGRQGFSLAANWTSFLIELVCPEMYICPLFPRWRIFLCVDLQLLNTSLRCFICTKFPRSCDVSSCSHFQSPHSASASLGCCPCPLRGE